MRLLGDTEKGRAFLYKQLISKEEVDQRYRVNAGMIAWQLAEAGDARVETFALDVFKRLATAQKDGDNVKYDVESWTYILLKLNQPTGVKLIESIATDDQHPLHQAVMKAKR